MAVKRILKGMRPRSRNRFQKGIPISIGIGTIVILSLILYSPSQEEPSYEGRTLNSWLNDPGLTRAGESMAIDHAIIQMGAEAVPHLERIMQKQDSWLRGPYLRIRKAFPSALAERLPDWRISARTKALKAACLLGELGILATNAVDTLTKAATNQKDGGMQMNSVLSLGKIAPGTNRRDEALQTLVNVAKAPPIDQYLNGRHNAYMSISKFTLSPNELSIVIPTLKNGLDDRATRNAAAYCSGEIGAPALPLLPRLLSALNDQDRNVRIVATNAVQKVAPKKAATLGNTDTLGLKR
ncbi:hypothetical protein N8612_03650 [Verrucomicrobia bacterium]|nr:hypothetical protein [Verrucomicrobiota bacterium]